MAHTIRLRRWQRSALEAFQARPGADFLAVATPGAGKTTFALAAARQHLGEHPRRRLRGGRAHPAPQDAVGGRRRGARPAPGAGVVGLGRAPAAGHARHGHDLPAGGRRAPAALGRHRARRLRGARRGPPLRGGARLGRRRPGRVRGLGGAAQPLGHALPVGHARDPVRARTTTTAWRRRTSSTATATPSRTAAWSARCASRAPTARWSGSAATALYATACFQDALDPVAAAQRLRTALSADGDWLPEVLGRAHERLLEVRRSHPGAGGMVIAIDQDHARGGRGADAAAGRRRRRRW